MSPSRLSAPLLLAAACSQQAEAQYREAPAETPPQSASEAPPPLPTASALASATPPAPSVPPAPTDDRPRVYSKARFTWIHDGPTDRSAWLGYLFLGGSAPLKTGKPVYPGAVGCSWYEVEPKGFVCAGGQGLAATATLDPKDPVYQQAAKLAPDLSSPWPYEYGESIGAPRYAGLPTADEVTRREPDLAKHRELVQKLGAQTDRGVGVTFPPLVPKARFTAEELLEGVDCSGAKGPPTPFFPVGQLVREARDYVVRGSTVAWRQDVAHEGRPYLLASDHAVIPKDRVRPYPKAQFAGVHLTADVRLPLAFFREKTRPKYKRAGAGAFERTDAVFARLSWVMLTDKLEKAGAKTYLETREPGVWIDADDATVAARAAEPPQRDLREGKGRRTWLDVSVLGGWLVAYEGREPKFATLISPGRGGVPYPGVDPLKTASTPLGLFRVDGKFRTATMVSSSDKNIVHADVNWVMNFHGPHALHGAYWHDVWGELRSGGCINLSPRDAKWVFEWTDPPIPDGWHGIRSVESLGMPTLVHVHP